MWKHIGAAAVILAISGCASNAPSSADVAQTQANLANIESAADASCPVTALQVHDWARKGREAIALDDASLLAIAQNGMTLAASGCKVEKDNPQLFVFDPAPLDQFKRTGSASMVGQAFLRQRGGGVVTCAGQSVLLMVETHYVDAMINVESPPPAVVQHLAASIARTATCDSEGRFAFKDLVPGSYLVETSATWLAGDETQGGPLKKSVKVSPGDNDVILSQQAKHTVTTGTITH